VKKNGPFDMVQMDQWIKKQISMERS